jgi:hypothetical protein
VRTSGSRRRRTARHDAVAEIEMSRQRNL